MAGEQIDFWGHLKQLGEREDVELYRLLGRERSGGHSVDVFAAESEDIETVIRPWQEDMIGIVEEGQTGHTPGFKLYTSDSTGLKRNDRVHWDGGAFRVVNPQHDAFSGIVRWDIRDDEREFITIDEIPDTDEDDLDDPPSGRFGEY